MQVKWIFGCLKIIKIFIINLKYKIMAQNIIKTAIKIKMLYT